MSLQGKAVVITGGSRGIGLHLARAFAAEGARLVLAARSLSELERACAELAAPGVTCLSRRTDVSNPQDVQGLIDFAVERLGRIDVLVNNAGIYGPIGALETAPIDEWRQAIEVNLLGTVYATRAVIPGMRAQGGGCILNLAGAGVGGPAVTPRISAYATSKAAVVQFTESIARELAGTGILINAIAPGAVTTEITNAVIAAGPERAGRDFYERNLKQKASGGDSPDLAARLAVYLASGRAGALTGKLLSAKWDQLEGLDAEAANRSSLYALRRVDEVLFREVRKP